MHKSLFQTESSALIYTVRTFRTQQCSKARLKYLPVIIKDKNGSKSILCFLKFYLKKKMVKVVENVLVHFISALMRCCIIDPGVHLHLNKQTNISLVLHPVFMTVPSSM